MKKSKFYVNLDPQLSKEESFEDEKKVQDNPIKNNNSIEVEKAEEVSKNWAEAEFATWNANLKNKEKKALVSYKSYSFQENDYLLEIEDKVEKRNSFSQDSNKVTPKDKGLKKVSTIDKALEKSKLTKPIYVYKKVTEAHFFPEQAEATLTTNSSKGASFVDEKIVNKIQRQFIEPQKKYLNPFFVNATLSENPQEKVKELAEKPILLRMKLPEGTNAAYMGEYGGKNEILIGRNNVFKYTKVSMEKVDGLNFLQVDMELVRSREQNQTNFSKKEDLKTRSNDSLMHQNAEKNVTEINQSQTKTKENLTNRPLPPLPSNQNDEVIYAEIEQFQQDEPKNSSSTTPTSLGNQNDEVIYAEIEQFQKEKIKTSSIPTQQIYQSKAINGAIPKVKSFQKDEPRNSSSTTPTSSGNQNDEVIYAKVNKPPKAKAKKLVDRSRPPMPKRPPIPPIPPVPPKRFEKDNLEIKQLPKAKDLRNQPSTSTLAPKTRRNFKEILTFNSLREEISNTKLGLFKSKKIWKPHKEKNKPTSNVVAKSYSKIEETYEK